MYTNIVCTSVHTLYVHAHLPMYTNIVCTSVHTLYVHAHHASIQLLGGPLIWWSISVMWFIWLGWLAPSYDSYGGAFIGWCIHRVVYSYSGAFIWWCIYMVVHSYGGPFIWWSIHMVVHSYGSPFIYGTWTICNMAHSVMNLLNNLLMRYMSLKIIQNLSYALWASIFLSLILGNSEESIGDIY